MSSKKKIIIIAIFIGFLELLAASGYFAYKSVTSPGSAFQFTGGRGAQSIETIDHYLAVLCFIGALALLVFAKKVWVSK
ncbi:MAG: hypothetical protein JAY84_08950 [Candidatus Thiodiazotropha taylori]|nr:hypothetical protein [Candidatus Thiodiazotropha taylori]